MSELFSCSLDYLLKGAEETDSKRPASEQSPIFRIRFRERKSENIVFGIHLWHIGRNARGFVAVGLNARGVIAVGLKANGIISFGMLSMGMLSLGIFSLGLLSIGLFALGILSAGCFSVGVLSVGKYFALGDNARGMIAIGDTQAVGRVFQKSSELIAQNTAVSTLTEADITTVKNILDTIVPSYLSWAKEIIKLFL